MRSLVALPLALLFVVACGDDGENNDNDNDDNTSDQDQDQDDNDQPVPDAAPDAPDASTLPDSSVPDGATPDGATPDGATPDGATPDGATPDSATPDAMIDGSVPTPDAMIDGSVPTPDAMIDGSVPTPDAMIDGSVPTPDAMIDGSVPTPDAMIDGSVPTPDAAIDGSVPTPDAATPDASIDAGTNSCTIAATLGTVTPPGQFAEETIQTGSVPNYTYAGLLNQDADFDAIQFELWDGFGVFAAGIVPGTYPITGDELDYATCGACIFAFGDVTDTAVTQAYFATGGSLTLTQVGPSMIGTLSNMTFGSLDNTTGNPDGLCTTTLTSFSFNVTITDNTARASGRRINFTPVGGKSPIAKSQVCWPKSAL